MASTSAIVFLTSLLLLEPSNPATIVMPKTFDCIRYSTAPCRTFPTLVSYQSNKESFKTGPNCISFTFQSIDRIPKNAFIAFESDYIQGINFSGKGIQWIQDGAFLSLRCLHVLDLSLNNLTALTQGAFQGLQALTTLNLNANRLKAIAGGEFADLANLQTLNLSGNEISTLAPNAFDGLFSLRTLMLASNDLKSVPEEAFEALGSLEDLQLQSNGLAYVEPWKWISLKMLASLNLGDNSLRSFDTSYGFPFASLALLNLSSNALTKLNVYSLRTNLTKLRVLDLNGNRWLCEDLGIIVQGLKDANVQLKGRYEGGDQIAGIHCSATADTYTERVTTTTSTITTGVDGVTETATKKLDGIVEKSLLNETEVLVAIKKTQHLVVSLIIIIVIFVALDLTVRTGIFNRITTTRHMGGDATNIEQIGLLQK